MKTVDLGVEWPRSIGGLSDLLHETRKSQTSKMRKIADQMVREREKRTESLSRKQAATEEVEIKITNISNADNLVQEEVIGSEQHLQDVKKAYVSDL